jgi:DNA polymerase III epsilon subunit-like protein
MPVNSHKIVLFDLETGGLSPKRHPIIQIAAIAVDHRLEPLEAFEAKVRFEEREASRHSLRKNHYHRGLWAKEALEPQEAANRFNDFLRRHATYPMISSSGRSYFVAQLIAHNASFDGPFLQTWYERLDTFLLARRQLLCTLQRALWYFHEHQDDPLPRDFKLATLCQYFGVAFHAAAAHEALADVSATLALCQAIRKRSAGNDLFIPACSEVMPVTEHSVQETAQRSDTCAAPCPPAYAPTAL